MQVLLGSAGAVPRFLAYAPRTMRRYVRSLTAILLGLLVLSWGPCPGTVFRSFARFETDRAANVAEADCGCGCCAGARTSRDPAQPEKPAPADDGCPYCAVWGSRPDITLDDTAQSVERPNAPVGVLVLAAATLPDRDAPMPRRALCQGIHGPPEQDRTGTVVLQV